jgi:phage host-nuclease inhibitor protein Gam
MATKKKRIKLIGPELTTRADVEETLQNVAHLTLLRDDQEVAMNEQLHCIRKLYEPKITNADQEIDRLSASLKTWAENNVDEFGKRKSIEMFFGAIGFRTGTPKLKTLSKWTWEKVKAALINHKMGHYTRTKTDVDKEKLLADRKTLGKEKLAEFGMKVHQDESFFVEVKRESIEPAAMAQGA